VGIVQVVALDRFEPGEGVAPKEHGGAKDLIDFLLEVAGIEDLESLKIYKEARELLLLSIEGKRFRVAEA
jgi:hypothetical protein